MLLGYLLYLIYIIMLVTSFPSCVHCIPSCRTASVTVYMFIWEPQESPNNYLCAHEEQSFTLMELFSSCTISRLILWP